MLLEQNAHRFLIFSVPIFFSNSSEIHALLVALSDAARRESSQSTDTDLWHSVFIRSFADLVHPRRSFNTLTRSSYIIDMLNSHLISFSDTVQARAREEKEIENMIGQTVFSCLSDAIRRERDQLSSLRPMNLPASIDLDPLISKSLGPRRMTFGSDFNLTASIHLCRWAETRISSRTDHTRWIVTFGRAVLRWLWSINSPTTGNLLCIIRHIPSQTPSGILEALVYMMESQQTWEHFDTSVLAALLQLQFGEHSHAFSTAASPPTLIEMISSLGFCFQDFHTDALTKPYWAALPILKYAFSALTELFFKQCHTRSIEELSYTAVDTTLFRILGPRQQSTISTLDVMTCLCLWSGENLFTRRHMSRTSLDSFYAALIRWMWSDGEPIDIFGHANMIMNYFNHSELVIALIRLEQSRSHTLDEAFRVLNKFERIECSDSEVGSCEKDQLAISLLELIATDTRQIRGTFSKEQADILSKTYKWLYRHHKDQPMNQSPVLAQSFWELWNDIYGMFCSVHAFADD